MSRIAIVTGGNKGIGYETVRGLAKSAKFDVVYLTARSVELGSVAAAKLNEEEKIKTVVFHQLDITNESSISKFASFISTEHGGFDVLVQNAGFAYKGSATEPVDVQAEGTFKVNVWGTLNVMKTFTPMVRENGRIVLVSSFTSFHAQMGFTPKFGNPLQRQLGLINRTLTLEQLEALANQFVADCKNGKNTENGWPNSCYATSKLFVNCITRVYAQEMEKKGKGVLVNCCCPGFVKTDMSSHSTHATKYPVDGCKTSLWLALVAPGAAGPQGVIMLDA